jgi:hypothetical protein
MEKIKYKNFVGNITRLIKSTRMRWTWDVAHTGEVINADCVHKNECRDSCSHESGG